MSRLNLPEFHETRFCPPGRRDELTDFLSFMTIYSGIYNPAIARIAGLLDSQRETRLVDLCSGGGLYNRRILERLTGRYGCRITRFTLTDIAPNRQWKKIAELTGNRISGHPAPLSAAEAIETLPGVHLMFSALHHFSPEELREMLDAGARNNRTLAFFDYSQRSAAELIPLLLSPLLVLLTSPLVYPFSWRRLLFTYLIPVLPLLLLVDGALSRWRSYTLPELEAVVRETGRPGYRVTVGVIPRWGGIAKIHWLIAIPETPIDISRKEDTVIENRNRKEKGNGDSRINQTLKGER
jgi:hypothetical protein